MISTVSDGNMHPNLPTLPETDAQSNFSRFCNANSLPRDQILGLRIDPVWTDGSRLVQEISDTAVYGSVDCYERIPAHALLSERTIGQFVLSGDCFPLVVTAQEHHVLGHIGWRSVEENLPKAIMSALEALKYKKSDLAVHIGPGLQRENNIRSTADTRQLSGSNSSLWANVIKELPGGKVAVDLQAALMQRLYEAGISNRQITVDDRDTFSDPALFSKRASVAVGKIRGNHAFVLPPVS